MISWGFAILGGAVIGLAITLYLLSIGKVVGISGILANALFNSSARKLSLVFILGLMIGGSAYAYLIGGQTPLPAPREPLLLIISGLLVGYGTRLGRGCTSGHGVCGNARLSPRSLLATIIFMVVAMLTVAVMY